MHRDSCSPLVLMHVPISSKSVGGIRQLIDQIPRIYATLMGYWLTGKARTTMRSFGCKSNLRMGKDILRRVFMMPCVVLLRAHLRCARRITLIGSDKGRVDGLWYAF